MSPESLTPEALDTIEAPLPNEARFAAYYYSFEPTGIGAVDAVLSAVAVAGKGQHSTEFWADGDDGFGYYKNRPGLVDGEDAEDLIQANANRSAQGIRALVAELRRLRTENERLEGENFDLDSIAQVNRMNFSDWQAMGAERDALQAKIDVALALTNRDRTFAEKLSLMPNGEPFPLVVSADFIRAALTGEATTPTKTQAEIDAAYWAGPGCEEDDRG